MVCTGFKTALALIYRLSIKSKQRQDAWFYSCHPMGLSMCYNVTNTMGLVMWSNEAMCSTHYMVPRLLSGGLA